MNLLRAGFQGSGSPRWLMRTIQRAGLDRHHGFALELCLLDESGHRHGTLAAVANGEADIADADWLAIAAARADGLPVAAIHPYGRILGSVLLAGHCAGSDLAALRGRRLGVLSLTDKNWAIVDTAYRKLTGRGLAGETEIKRFANRAELAAALDDGRIDAALVHWHMVPRLASGGHRVLAEIPALIDTLGIAAAPTTFFVAHEALLTSRTELVHGFIAAVRGAVATLRNDPASWHALADEFGNAIDPSAEVQMTDLRARWRDRIGDVPAFGPQSRDALNALYGHLYADSSDAPSVPRTTGVFHSAFLP